MPATPDKNDVIAQITAAWETAKLQLAELREAVERNAKLTATKVTHDGARREKDVALRELGEAVWDQVKRGKLVLPGTLAKAQKAVEEVERKLEAQASEISALLEEGDEAATRLRGKAASTNKSLASGAKKR